MVDEHQLVRPCRRYRVHDLTLGRGVGRPRDAPHRVLRPPGWRQLRIAGADGKTFKGSGGEGPPPAASSLRVLYGPAPEWPYYLRMEPSATLQDLAVKLENYRTPGAAAAPSPLRFSTLDAARERSRYLKRAPLRLAFAMALHGRLGAASPVACLGCDLLREVAAKWV